MRRFPPPWTVEQILGGFNASINVSERLALASSKFLFSGIIPSVHNHKRVLSMLSRLSLSLVLVWGVLASSSMSAQASPMPSVRPQPAAVITLVRNGCGWGSHMAACGCIRNYTACPVVVAPVVVAPHHVVAPVVVAPHHVVAPVVCPHGYYLDPHGRCLPY